MTEFLRLLHIIKKMIKLPYDDDNDILTSSIIIFNL
jgi:hypothetical protein